MDGCRQQMTARRGASPVRGSMRHLPIHGATSGPHRFHRQRQEGQSRDSECPVRTQHVQCRVRSHCVRVVSAPAAIVRKKVDRRQHAVRFPSMRRRIGHTVTLCPLNARVSLRVGLFRCWKS